MSNIYNPFEQSSQGGSNQNLNSDYIWYSSSVQQTIPDSTPTIIDFETMHADANSRVVTGSGWYYLVPNDGILTVRSLLTFENAQMNVSYYDSHVQVMNEDNTYNRYLLGTFGGNNNSTPATAAIGVRGSSHLKVSSGQKISVLLSHNVPSANRLTQADGMLNWVTMRLLPTNL